MFTIPTTKHHSQLQKNSENTKPSQKKTCSFFSFSFCTITLGVLGRAQGLIQSMKAWGYGVTEVMGKAGNWHGNSSMAGQITIQHHDSNKLNLRINPTTSAQVQHHFSDPHIRCPRRHSNSAHMNIGPLNQQKQATPQGHSHHRTNKTTSLPVLSCLPGKGKAWRTSKKHLIQEKDTRVNSEEVVANIVELRNGSQSFNFLLSYISIPQVVRK